MVPIWTTVRIFVTCIYWSFGKCNQGKSDNPALKIIKHVFQIIVILKIVSEPYPILHRHEKEEFFEDPVTERRDKFPSIYDEPTIELSVIVPAYDEEKRCKLLNETSPPLKS